MTGEEKAFRRDLQTGCLVFGKGARQSLFMTIHNRVEPRLLPEHLKLVKDKLAQAIQAYNVSLENEWLLKEEDLDDSIGGMVLTEQGRQQYISLVHDQCYSSNHLLRGLDILHKQIGMLMHHWFKKLGVPMLFIVGHARPCFPHRCDWLLFGND